MPLGAALEVDLKIGCLGGQSIGHYLHGSDSFLQSKALSDEKKVFVGSHVYVYIYI